MTVAARIEIVTGAHPEAGQSQPGARTPDKSPGAGWTGTIAASLSSSVPGAQSFRSSWQSMLATLGTGEEEAGAEGNSAATESLVAATAASASATTSPSAVGTSLRARPASAQQGASAKGATIFSRASSGAGISASHRASEGFRQAAANPAVKSPANVQPAEPANNTHAASAGQSAITESTSIATVPAVATMDSVPAAMPLPSFAVPVADATVQTRSFPAELSADPPIDFDIHSPGSYVPASGRPGASAGLAEAMGKQAAGGIEAEGEQAKATPAAAGDAQPAGRNGTAEESPDGTQDGTGIRDQGSGNIPAIDAIGAPAPSGTPSFIAAEEVAPSGRIQTPFQHSSVEPLLPLTPGTSPMKAQSASIGMEAGTTPMAGPATNSMFMSGAVASTPFGAASITNDEDASSVRMQAPAGGTLHPSTPSPTPIHAQSESRSIEAVPAPVAGPAAEIKPTVGDAATSASGPSQVLPPYAGMLSPAAGERPSAQAAPRITRGPGQVEPVTHTLAQPAAGIAADAATLAHNPTGAPGAMNAAGGISGDSNATAAPAALRETFAALDAESSSGTPSWIHTGAHRAEAGFQDPALGWVGVRADSSGGGVHASLVPGSAEAAVALGGHLAGLNAYLVEQHTPVESLTLAAPEGRPAEFGMDQGAGQSMHQGAGQDSGQGASSGQQSSPQTSEPVLTAATNRNLPAVAGRAETTAESVIPGGVHISVMA